MFGSRNSERERGQEGKGRSRLESYLMEYAEEINAIYVSNIISLLGKATSNCKGEEGRGKGEEGRGKRV